MASLIYQLIMSYYSWNEMHLQVIVSKSNEILTLKAIIEKASNDKNVVEADSSEENSFHVMEQKNDC